MAHILNASVVRQAAANRWPVVLAAIGVPADVLRNNRNQPCPVCGGGGRDRFQFLDHGRGRFVCRGIEGQGGDGFRLVMHLLNCDFKTALHAVADALGHTQADTPHNIQVEPTKVLTQVGSASTAEGLVAGKTRPGKWYRPQLPGRR